MEGSTFYNTNIRLHNGSTCTFVTKIDEDNFLIERDGAIYKIDCKALACHDNDGTLIGFRKQIPITLFWAPTVHTV